MTGGEVFALVILPGIIVLGAFGALTWHKHYLLQLTTGQTSNASINTQGDRDLAFAFARFESAFVRNRLDYTVEQLRSIHTPLGFSPK